MNIVGNFFLEMSYRVSIFIVSAIIKIDDMFHLGIVGWFDEGADMDE